MSNQQPKGFLRPADACEYLGIGRTTLHYLSNDDPHFPRKIHFSARCVGWRKSDLDAYLEFKAEQSRKGAA
jgi:predicted DNA-binding transcriptional regulator AlpA